ncbi:MAG: hypothetical protein GXP48_05965 [Acidobacteria bacterium]|nr:hypothetical protein [Acidobacteriota bacterium]
MSLLTKIKHVFSPPTPPADLRLGRNDPCWCGSGMKYKQCHLRSDERKRSANRAAARPAAPGLF